MNDMMWQTFGGLRFQISRASCAWHGRYLDATGLCSHCQREAAQEAQERAQVELARQVAVAGECADRAVMWGLA